MPLSDFQKTWTVKSSAGMTGETEKHQIKISLVVECLTDTSPIHNNFGNVTYDPVKNRIVGDGYEITYQAGPSGSPNEIFCKTNLHGPGSWTAEDNSGGGGDGDKPGHR
jgi:hypothetical protein